jgi:hypothetical protein
VAAKSIRASDNDAMAMTGDERPASSDPLSMGMQFLLVQLGMASFEHGVAMRRHNRGRRRGMKRGQP